MKLKRKQINITGKKNDFNGLIAKKLGFELGEKEEYHDDGYSFFFFPFVFFFLCFFPPYFILNQNK